MILSNISGKTNKNNNQNIQSINNSIISRIKLNCHLIGVYFNDCTKLIYNPRTSKISFIERNTTKEKDMMYNFGIKDIIAPVIPSIAAITMARFPSQLFLNIVDSLKL